MKFVGKVEKLVFGGKGLVRHEGFVYFVPDVAQGEVIEAEVVSKKKSYGSLQLCSVIESSPMRVQPKCPYFGICGGCQLQHLSYDEQLRQKKAWLIETLARIGKISVEPPVELPVEVTAAEKPYGYRRKVRLHFDGTTVGYYARDGVTLLDIKTCPIFYDGSASIFTLLHEALTAHEIGPVEILLLRDAEESFMAHLTFPQAIPKDSHLLLHELSKACTKVWLEDAKKTIGSDLSLELTVLGLTCYYSPRVFMQNAPEQFLQVYTDILDAIQEGAKILDVYCGVGIFSLLAARKGHCVAGVELSQEAIACAKKSAEYNGISTAQFFAKAAEEVDALLNVDTYDTWLVNPPRGGLSPTMKEKLLRAAPETIFYISCEPSTLARDLSVLSLTYKIKALHIYDMFSQTTHFETVVQLVHCHANA